MCKEKCNNEKCKCNNEQTNEKIIKQEYCDCGSDDESLQCSCEICK